MIVGVKIGGRSNILALSIIALGHRVGGVTELEYRLGLQLSVVFPSAEAQTRA